MEKELESVIDLIASGQGRVNAFISNIDSIGQSVRDGTLGKKAAANGILDVLPKAREMRGSLNGIKERCEIALRGE